MGSSAPLWRPLSPAQGDSHMCWRTGVNLLTLFSTELHGCPQLLKLMDEATDVLGPCNRWFPQALVVWGKKSSSSLRISLCSRGPPRMACASCALQSLTKWLVLLLTSPLPPSHSTWDPNMNPCNCTKGQIWGRAMTLGLKVTGHTP